MSDVSLAIERLLPAAEYGGSLTANDRAAFEALDWRDARPKPAWSAIVSKMADLDAETSARDYRAKRKEAYLKELGTHLPGEPLSYENTIGDILDVLIAEIVALRNGAPATPAFDGMLAKVSDIKGRFPKP